MIFSNTTRENYWILSKLLVNYDISIIKKILCYKDKLEQEETIHWYIKQGITLNKLRINNSNKIFIEKALFNPYSETYHMLKNIHIKVFHFKIIFETFSHKGFVLNDYSNDYTSNNYTSNNYSIPTIREQIDTINYYVDKYGISELYGKIFQYRSTKLTDLIGNQCIRSIIRKKKDDKIIYEYKTIAKVGDDFTDPVERLPTMI